MVRTRSGAGIEIPRRNIRATMADAAPEEPGPPQGEVAVAEELPPVPEEDILQLTTRHATNLGGSGR